jgi:hypothetical protein
MLTEAEFAAQYPHITYEEYLRDYYRLDAELRQQYDQEDQEVNELLQSTEANGLVVYQGDFLCLACGTPREPAAQGPYVECCQLTSGFAVTPPAPHHVNPQIQVIRIQPLFARKELTSYRVLWHIPQNCTRLLPRDKSQSGTLLHYLVSFAVDDELVQLLSNFQ